MTTSPHVTMMRLRRTAFRFIPVLSLVLLVSAAFAAKDDVKRELYRKGMDAVNSGDAIAARDAFCTLATKDGGYADASSQCAMYVPVAQRILNRYKINYAEGVTLLAGNRYDEAELRLRNVRAGEYAEQAQKKLTEIPKLRVTHAVTPEAEFERLLHLGDSGANFMAVCDGNDRFESYNRTDQHTTQSLFCGGWVRGASQALRLRTVAASNREVCLPATVSVGLQTKLLLQYIQQHPNEANAAASDLLNRALKSAYPCRVLKNDPDAGMFESQ